MLKIPKNLNKLLGRGVYLWCDFDFNNIKKMKITAVNTRLSPEGHSVVSVTLNGWQTAYPNCMYNTKKEAYVYALKETREKQEKAIYNIDEAIRRCCLPEVIKLYIAHKEQIEKRIKRLERKVANDRKDI